MPDRAPLALGLFMPNCSNMPSISTHDVVEDQWTYASNERIALRYSDAERGLVSFVAPLRHEESMQRSYRTRNNKSDKACRLSRCRRIR